MEYVLKVSQKGQVILPKKLRESLKIKELVVVDVSDSEGVMKKPEMVTDKLAGCFKKYAAKKKVPLDRAIEKAVGMVAREVAEKNH
ncbi:MAG: AbrB/MazE/SpoVT family DNA-binding domain-containing protein [Nitrospiraceae bacterium]|nr:AbrB/MazE/SpoVT family DNA-binding domain-containing protein [Nitrospiraceae bacterium]